MFVKNARHCAPQVAPAGQAIALRRQEETEGSQHEGAESRLEEVARACWYRA